MGEAAKTAERYREHAERLRVVAADDRDPAIVDTLTRIAQSYDSLADNLEAIEFSERRLMRNRMAI